MNFLFFGLYLTFSLLFQPRSVAENRNNSRSMENLDRNNVNDDRGVRGGERPNSFAAVTTANAAHAHAQEQQRKSEERRAAKQQQQQHQHRDASAKASAAAAAEKRENRKSGAGLTSSPSKDERRPHSSGASRGSSASLHNTVNPILAEVRGL